MLHFPHPHLSGLVCELQNSLALWQLLHTCQQTCWWITVSYEVQRCNNPSWQRPLDVDHCAKMTEFILNLLNLIKVVWHLKNEAVERLHLCNGPIQRDLDWIARSEQTVHKLYIYATQLQTMHVLLQSHIIYIKSCKISNHTSYLTRVEYPIWSTQPPWCCGEYAAAAHWVESWRRLLVSWYASLSWTKYGRSFVPNEASANHPSTENE